MKSNNKLLCFLVMFVSFHAFPQTQLGKTYSIAEEDALKEINRKAKVLPAINEIDITTTTAFKGYPLPENSKDGETLISPFYTLEFDVTDSNGKVIYPKGFTYNVAEYVDLPFRVVVFAERQIDFVRPLLQPTDILLLSEGDIFAARSKLEGTLFYLDERIAERLYVKGVPSIVTQVGAQYRIAELHMAEE